MKETNKKLFLLFLVIAIFGFGEGFFYNFEELWLRDNNLTIKTISIITSLWALVSVLFIFFCSNLIQRHRLKRFVSILLFLKSLSLIFLFSLNHSGNHFLIKLLFLLEGAIDTEITVCLYPLLSLVKTDDKLYSKKDIVYPLFYFLSLLISGILLGKQISFINMNYNSYCIISAILILIAFILLCSINIKVKEEKVTNEIIIVSLSKKLIKDKISILYFLYLLFDQISYYSLMGLPMSLLTNHFHFAPAFASNFRVLLGISAAIFGYFVLKFLTFKNDYANYSIKYLSRGIILTLTLILMKNELYIASYALFLFLSSSYSHIIHAPYINRYSGKYQFAFCNLREMIVYLGAFIGIYFCGIGLNNHLWLNCIISLLFLLLQLIFGYTAIYYRKKEAK